MKGVTVNGRGLRQKEMKMEWSMGFLEINTQDLGPLGYRFIIRSVKILQIALAEGILSTIIRDLFPPYPFPSPPDRPLT